MSMPRPLRERLQSNSPEPDLARPTTPLRITKHASPQPRQGLSPRPQSGLPQTQVARRSSNSFKHVRENHLVTKSPFRTLIPQALAVPGPSPRRVSGEKRPRPDSMHAQAEKDKPLGFKRRQSKAFQGLLEKEPVTKSPFRHSTELTSSSSDPAHLPPPRLKSKSVVTQSAIPAPSPIRGVLSSPRKMVGPRGFGQRQPQKQKTVTFDDRCEVLELSDNDDYVEDVSYDEDGYGYGYTFGTAPDEDEDMEDEYETSLPVGEDSLTGMVDSMLEDTRPHTPPNPDEEEDAALLPPSPSPAQPLLGPSEEPQQTPSSTAPDDAAREDRESPSQLKDEAPPFEDSFRSNRSNDSLDPANLSIGNSEVSISNLDNHSLLAGVEFDGEILTEASFVPVASSSPRLRRRSGSETPLDRSFDRSFEARSTPSLTPSRFNSPRNGTSSPFQRQLFKPASTSSLGDIPSRRASPHSPITREVIQERLLKRKSEEALAANRSRDASPAPVAGPSAPPADVDEQEPAWHDDADVSRDTEPDARPEPTCLHGSDPALATLPLMQRGQHPTHDGVLSIDPEPQPIDPPRPMLLERAHSAGPAPVEMDAKTAFAGLELDFEHGFGLGEEGMSVSAGLASRAKHSSMHLGDVSALDKLMEDMAQGAGVGVSANASVISEGQSYASLRVEAVTEGVKAETFSLPAIVRDDRGMGIDVDMEPSMSNIEIPKTFAAFSASPSPPPPPPPAKDAIRAREELIKAKRRELRQMEEDDMDSEMGSPALLRPRATGRPASRKSMSTGDAPDILEPRPTGPRIVAASADDDNLLDITALRNRDAPLAETINRELKKREQVKRSKYLVREHTETIYASADAGASTPSSSDDGGQKAWRAIRRPSDMNEYARQLRELREQQSGKAHGKVFVRVMGLRKLQVPIPEQPTKITVTLNNGIHFVTTPEALLGRDCTIDQEFELVEHSKLEFTLTIKVKKDPHIASQVKANQPPPVVRPPPQPLPPPASKGNHSKGGMRSFLGLGSPKKPKTAQRAASPAPTPPPPPPESSKFRMPENLARYLKPDGSLARTLVEFNKIAAHCDTRLLETAYPLVAQKNELPGTKPSQLTIGEIVLQVFRLPPLPGIPLDQLPQSLEECHRGLTHTRWHKSCYMQGTLTQLGGDCTTWRRRHLRIIGSSLVAYNDVTRRAIASIDLRKATKVEDESAPTRCRSPSSMLAPNWYDDDDPYGVGSVERAFRLEFGSEHIKFYADTDAEKDDWLKILSAMIGRIPPNPLWAELLFQRQEQARHAQQVSASTPGPSSVR